MSEHHHEHHQPVQAVRAEALESILIEKGVLSADRVDDIITMFNERVGPLNGARVVARAWVDAEFKQRLLDDATEALKEFDFENADVQKLVVVENTAARHNAVVCTLCSCYPWAVLGLPPRWYKDPAYRSRIVREPRKVLAEFGLELDDDVDIQVWDSSSEVRYMVLPERPAGTESMSEEELIALVTRDSMVGVERLEAPA